MQISRIIFVACLSVLDRVLCGRKNELNLSKGDPSPLLFWPIQTSKHNQTNTAGKMLAILHEVDLVPGPTTNTGILDALNFTGMQTSYVEIENINGILNGDNAMNWMFYVYFSNSMQTAILLEYHDGGNSTGFGIGLSVGKLTAHFYDHTGLLYNFQSTFTLPGLVWNFVGVNFNKLWDDDQFDLFMINTAGSLISETFGLGDAPFVLIQAFGSVVLGSNHLGSQNFEGKIACIQFSNLSQIHGPQENAVDLCDPNLWTDPEYGELTQDAVTTTTAPPTTTMTTTPTTMTTTTTMTNTTAMTTTTPHVIATTTTTTTYSNTTALVCNANDTAICHCFTTFTSDELYRKLYMFRKLLVVDKRTTSAAIRLRTSALDDRTSAKAIGGFGVATLISLTIGIVLPDIIDLISYMHNSCQAKTASYVTN